MGRPLPKRFFGNTNTIGTGGESVASVTIAGTNNAYITIPTFTFDDPLLVGGVKAVGAAHMAVVGITNHTAGTGMTPLQVCTLTGGTGTKGTIRVDTTSIATLAVGTSGGTGYSTGDVVTIQTGTGTLGTGTVVCSGGPGTAVTSFSTFSPGSYTVNPTTLTNVATVKVGGGGDDALVVNITMGANTATILTDGDYSVLPANVTIVGSGTGKPLWNLTFKVLSIALTEAGSGYNVIPVVTVGSGNATGTAVLTSVNENSIAVSAWTTALGSNLTGGDIVKQVGARRFLVTTSDGSGRCDMVARTPAAVGEMMVTCTDSDGKTYYVTKLTRHKATLTQFGAGVHQFATGAAVPFNFDAAEEDVSVLIANA